jgi:hypothetical protein
MSRGFYRMKPDEPQFEEMISDQLYIKGTDILFILGCKAMEKGELKQVAMGLRRKHVKKLIKEAQKWLDGNSDGSLV